MTDDGRFLGEHALPGVLPDGVLPDGVVPERMLAGLRALGVLPARQSVGGIRLAGGVSSDIWRVDLASGPVCAKRALPRLRVRREWVVATTRTAYEAAWLRAAGAAVPGTACPVRGFDPTTGVLVLDWLEPDVHPDWKSSLAAGRIDVHVAAAVGDRIGRLHAALADADRLAQRFDSRELFRALRLDPYFGVTARSRPELAERIHEVSSRTAATGLTVIHGDVSPKNILVGPDGPILVDAECATWGDPAFDLSFCLSHLLLKAVWHPEDADVLRAAAEELVSAYLPHVDWEPAPALERRAAALIPALALARVDGASPVEYLDEERGRPEVRRLASALLLDGADDTLAVSDRWFDGLGPADSTSTHRHEHEAAP